MKIEIIFLLEKYNLHYCYIQYDMLSQRWSGEVTDCKVDHRLINPERIPVKNYRRGIADFFGVI